MNEFRQNANSDDFWQNFDQIPIAVIRMIGSRPHRVVNPWPALLGLALLDLLLGERPLGHELINEWLRFEARSRLYQHRFLPLNTHFAALFEIYKIIKTDFRSLQFFNAFAPFFCFNDSILFHLISLKLQGSEMSFFRPNLNGCLSEFREMMKN